MMTNTVMRMEKIKRCPGCGGTCDIQKKKNGQYQFTCFKFGCITIISDSLDSGIRMWNDKRFAEVSR